ncbi:hypothetical protein DCAR_0312764 [Daucus carota subsp. sativus]|uniref:Uncharacterized protein n=2 Tax=Daucus carota subsp. sativus TaxID=79200 RepID=A0AAF1AV86_DAUCS|nr:hypothetical protein DCAR_0312764 [Daucus carota subsp. sativus]
MSVGFMLLNPDDAVVWRGLRKNGIIKQFSKDVYRGELHFLMVDVTEYLSIEINLMQERAPELLNLVACGEAFDSSVGRAAKMCVDAGVSFLGKVPLDPQLCKAVEESRSCFSDSKCAASAPALKQIIEKLVAT